MGETSGTTICAMASLTPGITYYVRGYATNEAGTAYGNIVSFITLPKDVDGNVYNYVKINGQVWMAENLKTTKYNNGDLIGTSSPLTKDMNLEVTPKYQWPAYGSESNVQTFGRLYTWFAANDSRKVCPTGWRLPTEADWTALIIYLGGSEIAGAKLKEAGLNHWATPNTGATNESGFNAIPGGYRLTSGSFYNYAGRYDVWWGSAEVSATHAPHWGVGYVYSNIYRIEEDKRQGVSIRCIKGN